MAVITSKTSLKWVGFSAACPLPRLLFLSVYFALCGVYGLSGFYSKDGILIAGSLANPSVFYLLFGGAFLTRWLHGSSILGCLPRCPQVGGC